MNTTLSPITGKAARVTLLPRLSHVLAPTDFSRLSDAAVNVATTLVTNTPEASLTLLHVVEPLHLIGTPDCGVPPDITLSHRVNQADKEMQRIRAAHGSLPSLFTRVVVGNPARDICDMASAENFDLIVLSSHGRTGLARALIGSVAERVVQEAPCPILVIKPVRNEGGDFKLTDVPLAFDRLLVGFDHRTGAAHALEIAKELAQKSAGHLTLVQALDAPPSHGLSDHTKTADDTERVQRAISELNRLRAEHLPEAADWDIHVEIGEPWDVIMKVAKESSSDLIVVGPHEYTRWGHCFAGSTAQRVVRLAPCPVLLVK